MHMHHEAMAAAPELLARGDVMLALFLMGLVGGLTHCAGMCGPFVLAQGGRREEEKPLWARLMGAALLPYQAGRVTTYVAIGVIGASLAAPLRDLSWFRDVAAVLLIAAGLIFFFNAVPSLKPRLFPGFGFFPEFLSRGVRPLFADPRGIRGYALGVALGFLPCGFLYAALLSVTAAADPVTAALGMLAFGLGTVPALVGIAFGGHVASLRFGFFKKVLFPALMIINGIALFMKAGEMLL